jgi:hypothetical protein
MARWTPRRGSAPGGVAPAIGWENGLLGTGVDPADKRRSPVVPRGTPDRWPRPGERPVPPTGTQPGGMPLNGDAARSAGTRGADGGVSPPTGGPSSAERSPAVGSPVLLASQRHFWPCSPAMIAATRLGWRGRLPRAPAAQAATVRHLGPRAWGSSISRPWRGGQPIRRSLVWADSSSGCDELLNRSAGVFQEGLAWAIAEPGDVVEGVLVLV